MKYILLIIIGFVFSLSLRAQSGENLVEGPDTVINQDLNKFYLKLAGGTQVLFSQDADELDLNDRFTPHFSLSFGKWISPLWGAELKVQGASLNGFSAADGVSPDNEENRNTFESDPVRQYVTIRPDGSYRHFIRYSDVSVGLFASISSLLVGRDKVHRFDILPSAGVGWMHVFSYKGIPANNALSYHFGLAASYRISSRLSLSLNGSGMLVPNDFEGREAGSRQFDTIGSFDLGLVWFLNP